MKLAPMILLLASLGFASSAEASPVASPDTVLLEQVTVTAIKSDRGLRSSSASTSISASEAKRLHIESVKGASDVVPNFFVPDYGSRITSSIYVRGIGARIDQPAVGLNVDNVPFLNKDAYDFDLQDISSIKMIRGPQSTLYGRNTMAGVINITTLSPLEFQGIRAMAQYGKANTWRLGAGYYTKINSHTGISANVRGGGSDGFFTNDYTGEKCDYEHTVDGRVKLHYAGANGLNILNTFAASWLKQGGYPYEFVETGRIAYNDTCSYRRTSLNDGLTISLPIGSLSLSSITSWQYIDDAMNLDQDFLPLDYFTLLQAKRENAVTQDFIVKYADSSVYSGLSGIFGFYRHMHMDAPVTFHDTGIAQLIEHNRNEANPYYPIRWKERSFLLDSDFINPAWGLAIYHNSTVRLGNFTIEGALRLDYERTSLSYQSYTSTEYEILHCQQPGGTPEHYRDVPILIDEQGDMHRSFLQLLPRLSASWLTTGFDYSLEVYGSVAKGYKAGGYNTQMFSDVLQQRLMWQMGIGMRYDVDQIVSYKPEKSWNYEIGARLNMPVARLRAEASVFYIDVRDQQLTMFPDGTTTGRIMTNAGKTYSYGFELSAYWEPLEALGFSAAYGHTTAKFRDFFNGKEQFKGNFLPYAPANTLFLGATYRLPLKGDNSLEFNANMKGTGSIYWNEANSLKQPFYALLGASVAYNHPRFSVELWGKNLTNTRFHTFYFVSISHEFVQRGRPIDFGITLNLKI